MVEKFQYVSRRLPINFKSIDLFLFEHELFRILPISQKLLLKYFLFDASGNFISYKNLCVYVKEKSNFSKLSIFKLCLLFLKVLFKGKFVFKNSPSVWFTDSWSVGYFHWMMDALPRLLESGLNKETNILLPSHFSSLPYVLPTLYGLGYRNVNFMQPNKYYLFNNLFFNTHSAPTGNYNEKTVRQLRDVFTNNIKDDSTNLGDRIFVSRAKAERRKITNETDLYFLLKKFGFSIVHFENYSWNQQVAICSKAKCMIGLHGAGLSNMLFMHENSIVLEFRKTDDSHNNCYFSLASALGHLYYYLQCNTDTEELLNSNFMVDQKNFEEVLELIFNIKH